MNLIMRRKAFFITLCCLFLIPSVCSSQEERAENNPDYSYGEIIKATAEDFDVLEYDYEKDEERVVNYSLGADAILTNFRTLTQLAQGDTVEVYFTESSGNRVAQTVIKDSAANPVDDQAPSPEQGSSSAQAQ
jgi:hypothetical protein